MQPTYLIIIFKLKYLHLLEGRIASSDKQGFLKQTHNEKFTLKEIQDLFLEVFEGKITEAHKFYALIKTERIIWFFADD